jgi:hypothetical protein
MGDKWSGNMQFAMFNLGLAVCNKGSERKGIQWIRLINGFWNIILQIPTHWNFVHMYQHTFLEKSYGWDVNESFLRNFTATYQVTRYDNILIPEPGYAANSPPSPTELLGATLGKERLWARNRAGRILIFLWRGSGRAELLLLIGRPSFRWLAANREKN